MGSMCIKCISHAIQDLINWFWARNIFRYSQQCSKPIPKLSRSTVCTYYNPYSAEQANFHGVQIYCPMRGPNIPWLVASAPTLPGYAPSPPWTPGPGPPLRRGLHRGAVRIIAPNLLSSCSDTLWTCASRWKAAGDNRWLHGRTDFELWPKSVIFQNHFMIGPNNLLDKLILEVAYWSKVALFDGNWEWWVRVKIFPEGRVDQDGNELSWPASSLNCLNSGPSRPPVARNTYHWPHPRPLPRIWTR